MKLELRQISHNRSLSEETPAYTATLYVDSVKAAHITNHGTGGCDMVRWFDRALEQKVNAHFDALPKKISDDLEMDGKPFEYQPTLEDWCQGEVWVLAEMRSLRKKKRLVGVVGKDIIEWKLDAKATVNHPVRATLTNKHPGIRFIDEMSDAELRDVIRS